MTPSPPTAPPRRIRALFIGHTALLGGAELALLRMLRKLDRARFDPHVLLFSPGPLEAALAEADVPVTVLRAASAELLTTKKDSLKPGALGKLRLLPDLARMVAAVRRVITDLGPDVAVTNSMKAHLIGGLAARWAGVPLLWYLHDRIAPDYMPGAAVRLVRTASLVLPHLVVANSLASLSTLPESLTHHVSAAWDAAGLTESDGSPARAGIIPPGVETVRPAPRTHLPRVIGICGRLAPWKGQDVFLDAAHIVLARYPDARFLIIGSAVFGETDFEAQLHAQVERLGLSAAVEFTGFTRTPEAYYDRLGLLVHASKTPEPFGQVVLEGMAAGLPVIATRAGGVLEIVRDHETGLLVPPADAAALATAMLHCLDHPEQSLALAARARAAATAFLTTRTADQLARVLTHLATIHPRTR